VDAPGRVVIIPSRSALAAAWIIAVGAVPIAAYLAGWDVVPVALVCGGALVLAEVTQGVILGHGQQRQYLRATVARSAVSVAFLAGLVVLPKSMRLSAAVGVLGLSALSFAAFGIKHLRIGRSPAYARSSALSAIGVANLGLWLLATGDRVVLGIRSGGAAVAVYAATYGLIDRVIRSFVNGHAAEWLPQAFALQRPERRLKNLIRLRSFAALLLVCVVALAFASGPAISLLTGGRFAPSVSMGALLAGGIGLLGIASPLYIMLVSAARARVAAWAASIAAGVNLCGNWMLDPRWGASAAAALTVVGYGTFVVIAAVGHRAATREADGVSMAGGEVGAIGWSES